MKIGILGSPGAEKSKFARALARNLEGNVAVVDNYVQRLQKASGLALGPWASYHENMMVAGLRESERAVKDKGDHQITVGTIMDTMTYVMVYSDITMHHQSRQEAVATYYDAQAVVNGLALWYTQSWNYDLCFFLYNTKGEHSNDIMEAFSYTLNQAYKFVLETFYVPDVYGLEGTTQERVKIATEVIEELTGDEAGDSSDSSDPASDEERAVRSGSEDGPSGRNPSESMPDVSIDGDRS